MRILLVNVYSHTDEGRRKYREFREILIQVTIWSINKLNRIAK